MSDEIKLGPGVKLIDLSDYAVEKKPVSSADCKEQLVNLIPGTKMSEWKRVSKKTHEGHTIRVFVNTRTDDQVTAVEEDEDCFDLYESGPHSPMLFYAASGQIYGDDCEDGMTFVMFAPKKFWERNHYIPDWHMQWYLENMLQVPEGYLDEASENQFMVEGELDETISKLQSYGFVYEPEMAKAGQWED